MVNYKNIPLTDVAYLLKIQKGTTGNYHCFNVDAHNNGDKNPSLSIHSNGVGFCCHACGVKGNNVELIKQVNKVNATQAFKWLEENFGRSQNQFPIEELVNSKESLQIRLIQKSKKRFIHKPKADLILKEPTQDDIQYILKYLGKSYSLETLKNAHIQINHRSGSYGMVFNKGSLEYNPEALKHYLHLEGRTDYLTAIELCLYKHFGLISDYNKTSIIDVTNGDHYFICDKDVNREQIIKRINTSVNFKIKCIKLPSEYDDLSDYYNKTNCNLNDILKIIKASPGEDFISKQKVTKKEPDFTFEIKSAADLQKMDIKVPNYIIPDLLPEHGTLLLCGSPKAGKTSLFTYLGLTLSEGWPAFGNIPIVKKYKVLFLALEDTDSRMKRKIEAIYNSEPTKTAWSENFIYLLEFPNMKQGGLSCLRQLIDSQNPDIIAIDTLERFIARGGSESYSGDYAIATELQNFTKEFKKLFIFLHHNRKAAGNNEVDIISGSYGISGSFDNFWIIQREANKITLSTGGRDLIAEKYSMKYDVDFNTWNIEGKHFEVAKSEAQDQVLNALKNVNEALSIREISETTSVSYETTKTRLSRMHQTGLISKNDKGKYFIAGSSVTCNQGLESVGITGIDEVTPHCNHV